jgi:hypothetical protein
MRRERFRQGETYQTHEVQPPVILLRPLASVEDGLVLMERPAAAGGGEERVVGRRRMGHRGRNGMTSSIRWSGLAKGASSIPPVRPPIALATIVPRCLPLEPSSPGYQVSKQDLNASQQRLAGCS